MQLPCRIAVRAFCVGLFLAGSLHAGHAADLKQAANGVTQIVAHRGASVEAPECTLGAIRRSMASGATAVEVDVRTTSDGQYVILHDATLDRTTNGKGPVNAQTLAAVRQLDAGSWFGPAWEGEQVPLLGEVLAACDGKIDVLLDLKETGPDYIAGVVAQVKAAGNPRGIIIGVRSVEQAKMFRKVLPEARQIGLIPTPNDIDAFAEAGVEMIRIWPNWLDKPERVERVRHHKLQLHLNGTTGTEEEIRKLLPYRPESLSSDAPAQLRKTLDDLLGS